MPPTPPLCDAVKNRIEQHIRPVAAIVEAEGGSTAAVYRIIGNILAFGTHTAPRRVAKRERATGQDISCCES